MSDPSKGGKKKKKTKGKGQFTDEKWENPTPAGQKKDFSGPMDDSYHPQRVEASWDAWWEKEGFFRADANSDKKEQFVMVIPPPNVTGTLHLGHALTSSVEDTLVRWHRMNGKEALWVPGFDHAGIATQVVVEKKLMRETGQSRHDLGREKFLEKVWEFKETNGKTIGQQLRRIGASVDWSRGVFTMDENRSNAVKHAFLKMFQKGYIYRSNRLVNWSCALKTAISKIEVDYLDIEKSTMLRVPNYDKKVEFGVLHDFAYKVKGTDEYLIVSTTRIETMLGDVAVAVHPNDDRYKHLHGKELEHPFIPDRKMIVITDDVLVDMAFGTGAVKITPAHDPNDFECGKRHGLRMINILDDAGLINENGGPFKGMKRFDVRTAIVKALEEKGLYRGKKNNKMSLGLCSRSNDIIEPVIRPQWWVRCTDMAARSVAAVKEKKLKIHPDVFEINWYRWLEEPQDWCISRQLWWGHRIPAYWANISAEEAGLTKEQLQTFEIESDDQEVKVDPRWIVAESKEKAEEEAAKRFPNAKGKIELNQDPDVLDTWFSSGLFPFSVFNWPNETADLKRFFPTSLLETGHDILFFWVARMVMMSLALTDQLPFEHVYLHAMVRDRTGRKMSKSLGNVIDPIDMMNGVALQVLQDKLKKGNLDPTEVKKASATQKKEYPNGIPECGADALRFGLLAYTTQARDINLNTDRIVSYRMFCNKIWNATKYGLSNLGDLKAKPLSEVLPSDLSKLGLAERWILSRLHAAVDSMDRCMKAYEFSGGTSAIYAFWKEELCGVYLELTKSIFKSKDSETARQILWWCYHFGLRLLHPFMPFVTEELFNRLPGAITAEQRTIVNAPYPKPEETAAYASAEVEHHMEILREIAHSNNSTKKALAITKACELIVVASDKTHYAVLSEHQETLLVLSGATKITVLESDKDVPAGCAKAIVPESTTLLFIPTKGNVDFKDQLMKLDRRLEDATASLEDTVQRTKGAGFAKMPEKVREKTLAKRDQLENELKEVESAIAGLHNLMEPAEIENISKICRNARFERRIVKCGKLAAKATSQADKLQAKLDKPKKPLNDKQIDKLTKQITKLRKEASEFLAKKAEEEAARDQGS